MALINILVLRYLVVTVLEIPHHQVGGHSTIKLCNLVWPIIEYGLKLREEGMHGSDCLPPVPDGTNIFSTKPRFNHWHLHKRSGTRNLRYHTIRQSLHMYLVSCAKMVSVRDGRSNNIEFTRTFYSSYLSQGRDARARLILP